jgi:hypothetical protein
VLCSSLLTYFDRPSVVLPQFLLREIDEGSPADRMLPWYHPFNSLLGSRSSVSEVSVRLFGHSLAGSRPFSTHPRSEHLGGRWASLCQKSSIDLIAAPVSVLHPRSFPHSLTHSLTHSSDSSPIVRSGRSFLVCSSRSLFTVSIHL